MWAPFSLFPFRKRRPFLLDRTRVRKSSAIGSTCLAGSLNLTECYPNGRENKQRFRLKFNDSTSDKLHRGLVWVDACSTEHKHYSRQTALWLVIKQLVRSCLRWQLLNLQLCLRGNLRLGMPLRFCIHVEASTPPCAFLSLFLHVTNALSSTGRYGLLSSRDINTSLYVILVSLMARVLYILYKPLSGVKPC